RQLAGIVFLAAIVRQKFESVAAGPELLVRCNRLARPLRLGRSPLHKRTGETGPAAQRAVGRLWGFEAPVRLDCLPGAVPRPAPPRASKAISIRTAAISTGFLIFGKLPRQWGFLSSGRRGNLCARVVREESGLASRATDFPGINSCGKQQLSPAGGTADGVGHDPPGKEEWPARPSGRNLVGLWPHSTAALAGPQGTRRTFARNDHHRNRGRTSGFTTCSAGHSPRLNFTMAWTAARAMSSRDWRSTPAACGVSTTLSSRSSGLSAGGSCSKTSRA